MRKFSYVLASVLLSTCAFGGSSITPFETGEIYSSSGVIGEWSSFATIGIALASVGFGLRTAILVKLAATGQGDFINVIWSFVWAVLGFAMVMTLLS